MSIHIIELLAAYHDGELPLNRQQQVESHLQDCPTCRAELEAFKELSSLLKADVVPNQTSPELFAAQVQLRLPRVLPRRTRQNRGQLPRWALGIPLVLIVIWAFMQAALKVTSFILAADQFFDDAGPFGNWITAEGLLKTNANLLLFNTILLIGTTILWSAWMALWMAWNKNQNELSIKGVVR